MSPAFLILKLAEKPLRNSVLFLGRERRHLLYRCVKGSAHNTNYMRVTDGQAHSSPQVHRLVIAAPHTPETEGLFRADKFARMKSSGVLINIGREGIVNHDDLCSALERDEIGGAALDVYEIEPLPAEHPLWGFENVILTPHVAGHSPEIAERHLAVLLDNAGRFVRGESLRNVADKQRWF